jgi:hypothetical protein
MSLRDLNWREGFFRLWLFLSAIWIAVTGIFGLYPATSRYIENVKAAHELKSLRAAVSYTYIEEQNPFDDIIPDPPNVKLPAGYKLDKKRYKAKELQTGVTVTFLWYDAQPPGQTDLDNVFWCALSGIFDPFDPLHTGLKPTPDDLRPRFSTPFKPKQELSQNESTLVQGLNRIEELRKLLESDENSKQDFLSNLGMTLLPPISLLIGGVGLFWAISGFASEQRK